MAGSFPRHVAFSISLESVLVVNEEKSAPKSSLLGQLPAKSHMTMFDTFRWCHGLFRPAKNTRPFAKKPRVLV